MTVNNAEFLINQMNPVLKRARMIYHHLQLDRENEDIEVCNMFGAVFYRLHYPDYKITGALKKLMEEMYG